MKRKPYKGHKRGAGRHVQLSEWLQASEAWSSLKPGPRALYVELKRRFNGSNNGAIYLSHRDAGAALNVTADTATGYFAALVDRGFVRLTVAPHLGPSGIGQASKWALEEEPTRDGKAAGKAFMAWRPKTKAPPENQDTPSQKSGHPSAGRHQNAVSVPKITTQNEVSPKPGVPKNGTYIHLAIGRSE